MVSVNNNNAVRFADLLSQHISGVAQSTLRLSSGNKLLAPQDDAAGLAMATRLDAQLARLDAASRNVSSAGSFAQTQDAHLRGLDGIVSRMGELAIKAQDGTMPDDIRALYDTEFQQLKEMVNDVRTAQLNDVNLFDGQAREVTVSPEGDSVTMGDVDLFTDEFNVLTANTTRLTSMEGARAALDATSAAGASVSIERANIGGTLSRLETASAQLTSQRESMTAAASRIRDTDVAQESTRLASEQIRAQSAVHALRQANARQGMVLELLRPSG